MSARESPRGRRLRPRILAVRIPCVVRESFPAYLDIEDFPKDIVMDQLVQDIAAAVRAGERLPRMPANLSVDEAYEIQKAVVAEVSGDALAGLKAGMTATALQKQFGLSDAVVGCLYEAGRMDPGVSFASAPGVMIECELGVVVDADGNPKSCGPVVEVPRLNPAPGEDQMGVSLIASSIASDRFIAGPQFPLLDSYDHVQVRLERDGEILSSASCLDALGGPHRAIGWLIQEAKKRRLPLEDGMLCITGACGGIHPAKPGHYLVEYGELGSIEFTVT